MQTRHRQRGWLGLIAILIVLVIVAILAKDALKSYGLLGGVAVKADPARQGERSRLPPAAQDATQGSSATPSFQAPIERARGVDAAVQSQAEDQRKRVEDATR